MNEQNKDYYFQGVPVFGDQNGFKNAVEPTATAKFNNLQVNGSNQNEMNNTGKIQMSENSEAHGDDESNPGQAQKNEAYQQNQFIKQINRYKKPKQNKNIEFTDNKKLQLKKNNFQSDHNLQTGRFQETVDINEQKKTPLSRNVFQNAEETLGPPVQFQQHGPMPTEVQPAATTFSNMNQIQIQNPGLNSPIEYETVQAIPTDSINPGYDTPEIGKTQGKGAIASNRDQPLQPPQQQTPSVDGESGLENDQEMRETSYFKQQTDDESPEAQKNTQDANQGWKNAVPSLSDLIQIQNQQVKEQQKQEIKESDRVNKNAKIKQSQLSDVIQMFKMTSKSQMKHHRLQPNVKQSNISIVPVSAITIADSYQGQVGMQASPLKNNPQQPFLFSPAGIKVPQAARAVTLQKTQQSKKIVSSQSPLKQPDIDEKVSEELRLELPSDKDYQNKNSSILIQQT